MSVQVVKDIQEALLREITTLATHVQATQTNINTANSFDPFTGEAVPLNIEGNLYSERSNPNQVDYPRVDLEYSGVREDRESGRMISIWEDLNTDYRELIEPNKNRPSVFEAVFSGNDGVVTASGLQLPALKYRKVQSSYLVKIISGTNLGTYRIATLNDLTSTLEFDDVLVSDIQEISFNERTRRLYILNPTDLYAVRAGDVFEDALGAEFTIVHIDTAQRELYLDGSATPDLGLDSLITRPGGALKHYDAGTVAYVVMDPSKPKTFIGCPTAQITDGWDSSHPATPFDYYFTIEIKNKDQPAHIAMADQMTNTIINRPRRKLSVLVREAASAESEVLEGPSAGFGQVIVVKDASRFRVNDSVWMINVSEISENNQIIDVDYITHTITLRNKVDVKFSFKNKAKLVSNASLKSWGMLVDNDSISIGQDNINNFYRQEYIFRIQGYKAEKSGVKTTGGITSIEGTLETHNRVIEPLKI